MALPFSLKKKTIPYKLHNVKDWPLGLRLFAILAPVFICVAIVSLLVGYYSLYPSYNKILYNRALIEASSLAEKTEGIFDDFHNNISLLAQNPATTAEEMQARAHDLFKKRLNLIAEIGIKKNDGKGFMWLREGDSYREVNATEVSQGPYSAFQQVSSIPLKEGEVTIFPAVNAYYPSTPERNKLAHLAIMRFAMPLPNQEGVVIIGINLHQLRNFLTIQATVPAAVQAEQHTSDTNFSYFFDANGWILFEMVKGQPANATPVDIARRGFTGDLGRAGLDIAFRPWAVHENFWGMVKDVQINTAGFMEVPAKYFASGQANSSATLCYVPVSFAPSNNAARIVVGGIAVITTSTAPYNALLGLFTSSLTLLVILSILLPLIFYGIHRKVGVPLFNFAKDIKNMLPTSEFFTITQQPEFKEHQMLLTGANGLIAQATNLQTTLTRMENEITSARSTQPVDLGQELSVGQQKIVADYGIVGSNKLIMHVREEIKRAAKAGTDVLIWGETGTGKELVAEAIHNCSTRKGGPLISINCGALDENLLLDVLFGHAKGAFTEAKTERKGAFLTAEGGTLHLDEIGTASLKVQQALLRALSIRRIRPLGTDIEVPFDTRVIAATNVDLRDAVKTGTFREDLYYRLAIISIKTPPLRHRKSDIPELAAFCLQEFAAKMGKTNVQISRGALDELMEYDWPGNVREFKNCLVRAIAFTEENLILPMHIVHNETEAEGDAMTMRRMFVEPTVAYEAHTDTNKALPSSEPTVKAVVTPPNLNERQSKVWFALLEQEFITRAEMQNIIGQDVTSRTLQFDLRQMIDLGLLAKLGAGPSTRYTLNKR